MKTMENSISAMGHGKKTWNPWKKWINSADERF
jgi:hypothetical protein